MKKITILGSTGSIGTQALDIISRYPEKFKIEGLAAGRNIPILMEQIERFKPAKVSVESRELMQEIEPIVPRGTKVYWGEEGLLEVASSTDANIVITAMVGSHGLKPTLAAIEAGKHIALANKETLVTAGHIVMDRAKQYNVSILPVDSEHSAIFQCLNGESRDDVEKIILTASGGSFRDRTREELKDVTVEMALRHPNWSMGAKITIDSATMVNKGLEVIEAHWLFDQPYENIEVVLHQESVVHSMVEFKDRSVIAQLGNPDMRVPILYALSYPQRMRTPADPLNITQFGALHFQPIDFARYPLLKLAFDCGKLGGTAPTVFNAANEEAVSYFLAGKISFLQIEHIVMRAVDRHEVIQAPELDEIELADRWARVEARGLAFG